MADDFERAVLISFNFTPGEEELKARASSFVNEIKRAPEAWGLCVERFSVTAYPEVKFWCLQTLHEIIRTSYPMLADAAKNVIKTALMTWVTRDCNNSQAPLPPFLRNKIAQTLVSVLQYEFPSTWPTFFEDLIRVMLPGCCAAVTPGGPMVLGPVVQGNEGVVDMFCRTLVSVDEDLVTLDIPRSQNESKLSMHVKDSMREHSIVDVAATWYSLAEAYATKAPELAAFVLQTMQRYICWIDINLVGNEKFTTLLQALLESGYSPLSLRGAAADCLAELLAKRMEPTAKLTLIKSMGIMDRCAKWAVSGFPLPPGSPAAQALSGTSSPSASGLSLADEDPAGAELLAKLAHLLASLATETMDCLKKVENGVISLTAMGFDVAEEATQEATAAAASATQLLDTLLPALLSAFRSGIDEVSMPMVPFMSAYVARLKTLHKRHSGTLPPDCVMHIRAMLSGIAVGARYPLEHSANDAGQGGIVTGPGGRSGPSPAAKDEQAEMDDKRRDLFTLYKNVAKVAYLEALGFVGSSLQAVVEAGAAAGADGVKHTPGARWQDVEIGVCLLYELGEAAAEEPAKAEGAGSLAALVTALAQACGAATPAYQTPGVRAMGGVAAQFTAALPAAGHRLVSLSVMETFVRYARVLQQSQALLPSVMVAFLDARGLGHPSEDVSTRACYLLCRLSKTLRSTLRPFLPDILSSLRDHLSRIATTPMVDVPAVQAVARDVASKAMAPATALLDDRLYVFEAVGLLLGQEEVQAEQQSAALSALLQPLTAQIKANLPSSQLQGAASPSLILQALEAAVRLNKGFKTELATRTRPQLGAMFGSVVEVALAVPREYPGHKLLRVRFISFVHRMVEGLQALLLPYLPSALEALLLVPQPDAADVIDVLQLLGQLMTRFKAVLAPLIEGLLPLLVSHVHCLLEAGGLWDWSGRLAEPQAAAAASVAAAASCAAAAGTSSPAANGVATAAVAATLEEARERGELQRAYYAFLYTLVVGTGMANVLLNMASAPSPVSVGATSLAGGQQAATPSILELVLTGIARGASSHIDPGVRRTCVQVFSRLTGDWCKGSEQSVAAASAEGSGAGKGETLPGFQHFSMERLAGDACCTGLLQAQPPLDGRDGLTSTLLQDCASALKLVYSRCGDELAAHLMNVAAPAAGLPPSLAQQLVHAVREQEQKDVKDILRGLLMQRSEAEAAASAAAR